MLLRTLHRSAPLLARASARPLRHAACRRAPPLVAAWLQPHAFFSTRTQDASPTAVLTWPDELVKAVHKRMKSFPRNYECKALAVEAGLNPAEWPVAATAFRNAFLRSPERFFADQSELLHFARDLDAQAQKLKRGSSFLFYPYFLDFCKAANYVPALDSDSMFTLQQLTDLRLPHELYPLAAAMKRRVVYHEGPTNSGKTHEALARLKRAGDDGGLYCGPLRLLALEVYERMNMDGLYTSLVTGQEKKLLPHATHVSCTVEMANINRRWDVAVIDEIQLIGDPQRGWAWTRAFFGLQANEIHVCGSSEAVHLVQKFCAASGDDFELRSYARRSPLEIDAEHLRSYRHVRPGDCVVAFSRREIFQIKREIEVKTGEKCCIIYGQLPPETRSQQARLFNARDNAYNILVASDAVGMGLNLNIARVVFSSVKKFSGGGGGMTDITPSLAKQIAGRAGRFGSAYASGVATCLQEADLKYLRESYEQPPTPLTSAGLFPSSDQMEEFAKQMPGITDLGDLIDKYVLLARLDGDYFLCNHADMKDAAALLRDVDMKLKDRFTFCMAPVNLRNPLARRVFLDYASAHARDESVQLDIYLPKYAPQTAEALRDVEIKAQIIDLYLWLSFRFETTFADRALAEERKARVLELVEQGLINTTYNKDAKRGSSHRWSSERRDASSSAPRYTSASSSAVGDSSSSQSQYRRPVLQHAQRRTPSGDGRKPSAADRFSDIEEAVREQQAEEEGGKYQSMETLASRIQSQWRKLSRGGGSGGGGQ
ncbi:hypothetical protein PybrP1_010350 [[Pythium] brassicae (nom. inval.)]|nr:hypothetical protein PybrP1_010350 [[Pythium] brassicae (nom. inval.)]